MTTTLIVPRRSDGGHRDRLWDWARNWWTECLGWPIVEGHHDDPGRFNRSIAVKRGVAQLDEDWTEFVIVDADSILARPAQLERAVEVARAQQRATYCHDQWCGLSKPGTETITSLPLGPGHNWGRYVEQRNWFPFSQCVVVPRSVWETVGGMDERFKGWGWEDIAFDRAHRTLCGGTERIHGELFHLWHPRSEEREHGHPDYVANHDLGSRYKRHAGDVEAIRAILSEPGGPLDDPLDRGGVLVPGVNLVMNETGTPEAVS